MIQQRFTRGVHSEVNSNLPSKQALLNLAKKHYLRAAHKHKTTDWYSCKVKLPHNINIPFEQITGLPTITIYPQFYDYDSAKDTNIWIVFSNKKIGGSYKGKGWVQEEIIATTFYEMAMGITYYEKDHSNIMLIDECFLWLNLLQNSEYNNMLYGKYFDKTSCNSNKYISSKEYINVVNFLSIDAPKIINGKCTLEQLQHLFIKCYTGFYSCTLFGKYIINTGGWGTGVYGNDPDLIFAIQVLIAKLSNVREIHFWGIDVNSTKIQILMKDVFVPNCNKSFVELFDITMQIFNIEVNYKQIFAPIL